MTRGAIISAYVRSPFTFAHKGALAKVRPDELLAQTIKGLTQAQDLNLDDIEDLIVGCAFPEGEQGLNIARLAVFLSGLPITVAGTTVNRFCGSSMQSIHMAAGAIACGAGDVFICAGVESMTRVPMTGFNPMPHPGLFDSYPQAYESMGITAENLANEYGIKRLLQEEMAVESHKKASDAQSDGRLKDEIIPITLSDGTVVDQDACIRPETTLEGLSELRPAFDTKGSVTAGTSSPLTDGASAVLVVSEEYAEKHNLPALARIKSFAVSGCKPEIMGIGPVGATQKALARAGLEKDDLDVIELNEAFAVQALACLDVLQCNRDKVNIDGGALALGHPLGATGARITGKAASLLARESGRYALASQCIGGGQGIATLLEAV